MRVGRPVAPREYREPPERMVVAVLAAVQAVMLVAGWKVAVVAVGITTLAWSARRR